ncbi:MAG: helix-turn-helix domain-containing protein [Actinomycetota bacterium]|nr:helix-turn-helix domain-containing protein [Actinomycetota bacterium]
MNDGAATSSFVGKGEFQRSSQRTGHDDRATPSDEPLEVPAWQVQVLSAEEREEIRVGCAGGESFALMARALGRSTSTISEEVRKNGGRLRYCAVAADRRTVKQRCRPKPTKFQSNNRELADHVEVRLAALDSPTTIAIKLARAGGISGDTVSPESIYQTVYGHGSRGLAAGVSPTASIVRGVVARSDAGQARRRRRPAHWGCST